MIYDPTGRGQSFNSRLINMVEDFYNLDTTGRDRIVETQIKLTATTKTSREGEERDEAVQSSPDKVRDENMSHELCEQRPSQVHTSTNKPMTEDPQVASHSKEQTDQTIGSKTTENALKPDARKD